jgi:hypothetical protein
MNEIYCRMADQHGLVSLDQARALGMTRKQVQSRVNGGEWVRMHRGVYRSAAAPPSWRAEVLAGALAVRGVASHRCAAALWGLAGWTEPPVEVLIPEPRRTTVALRIHRTTQLDRIDRQVRSAIPVTGIERTIIDLGAVVSLRRVELAAESALRQRLVTWPSLRMCLIRHARRGRDGCGRLRALLEARHGDEQLPASEWSRLVDHLLTDRGLPPAWLEHPVFDHSGVLFARLDLAWPSLKVAIELDSVRWHLNRTSFERDRRKRNRLRLQGWVIHEVTWTMSIEDPAGLAEFVRSALDLAA